MDPDVEWLGRMPYREAWELQRARHAARDAGQIADTLLLVEHEPVLTLGRHALDEHVLAGPEELQRRGIEVIRVERGGEVTFHGPGQLVAYPIVRLRERPVLLRPFVRALELTMGDVAARYGVAAAPRPGYPGVWVEQEGGWYYVRVSHTEPVIRVICEAQEASAADDLIRSLERQVRAAVAYTAGGA